MGPDPWELHFKRRVEVKNDRSFCAPRPCDVFHLGQNSDTGVCEQNTPPEKTTLGDMSFRSTTSGAGEQFLLQDCMAKADVKGVFFSQTPESDYQNSEFIHHLLEAIYSDCECARIESILYTTPLWVAVTKTRGCARDPVGRAGAYWHARAGGLASSREGVASRGANIVFVCVLSAGCMRCRVGLDSTDLVSTWFGILVSILLRPSGLKTHARPAACTW